MQREGESPRPAVRPKAGWTLGPGGGEIRLRAARRRRCASPAPACAAGAARALRSSSARELSQRFAPPRAHWPAARAASQWSGSGAASRAVPGLPAEPQPPECGRRPLGSPRPAELRGPWGLLREGRRGRRGKGARGSRWGAAGQVRVPGGASPGSPIAGRWHSHLLSGGRAAPTPPGEGGRGPLPAPLLYVGVIRGERSGRPRPGGAFAVPTAERAPVCVPPAQCRERPLPLHWSLPLDEGSSLKGGPHQVAAVCPLPRRLLSPDILCSWVFTGLQL